VQFVRLDAPETEASERAHMLDRHVACVGKEPGNRLDADLLASNDGTLCVSFEQCMENPNTPLVS
jgi:hypothetical protein